MDTYSLILRRSLPARSLTILGGLMDPVTRSYSLQVTYNGGAWTLRLFAADGSLLSYHTAGTAEDALHEVVEFLEEEAKLGFPVA